VDGERQRLAACRTHSTEGRILKQVESPEAKRRNDVRCGAIRIPLFRRSAKSDRLLEGSALDALVRYGEIELAAGHAIKRSKRPIVRWRSMNLREDAHRLIVQALVAAGRKAEALKHYQDLVALLERELSTEPMRQPGRSSPSSASAAAERIARCQGDRQARAAVDCALCQYEGSPEREVNAESPLVAGDEASASDEVLVVDDHALIREATHAVLKLLKRKTVVFEASSCRQAVQIVEKHPDISLVLLEYHSTYRDGFSASASCVAATRPLRSSFCRLRMIKTRSNGFQPGRLVSSRKRRNTGHGQRH